MAANVARSATEDAATGGDREKDSKEKEDAGRALSAILSADVVGFGNCSVGDIRSGKPGCGSGG